MKYHKPRYRFIYIAAFLLSLQYAFTLYINSSLLAKFFDTKTISDLYIAGASLTVFSLIVSGRFLKKFGNWKLVLSGIFVEICALLTIAFSNNPLIVASAFIVHQFVPPLILFGLDIFFEGVLVTVKDAEKTRSYYLTFLNSAFVIAPLAVGIIITKTSFNTVYLISAGFLCLLWFLIFDVFKDVRPTFYRETEIIPNIKRFLKRKNLPIIFLLNLLLQCFYAVMVIFMAPHLNKTIGLSWEAIGLLYTIMLMPFVIFEAPLGKLFEKYHNEKDFLIAGFIIVSVAVAFMANITIASLPLWAALLFTSRIGASFVEVSSEASFFKRVTDQDAGFISIFRLSAPTSYIIVPLVSGIILQAIPFQSLLTLTSILLLSGTVITYKLKH